MMFNRLITPELMQAPQESPAVVLPGPRQIGKTTLAYELSVPGGIHLDLKSPEARGKLGNVEGYSRARQDQLVVLDEVQRMPTVFDPLRGLIDHARRQAQKNKKSGCTGLYLPGPVADQKNG